MKSWQVGGPPLNSKIYRNPEQDNRVADFDNFCDEQISPMRGHPFTRNVRNAEQDNRVADFDNFCDEQISRMRGHPLQTTLPTHYCTLQNQET